VEAKKVAKTEAARSAGLLKYPRELLLVVGLTAGGTAAFYTFTTYMQTFVKTVRSASPKIRPHL